MSDDELTVPGPKDETEVWEAISAFEQILDVMPEDRSSLEALIHAYAHVGDQVKAQEYLIRYGHVLVDQQDREAARELVEQLSTLRDDPGVSALLDRFDMLLAGGNTVPPPQENTDLGGAVHVGSEAEPEGAPKPVEWEDQFEVSDELTFAWELFESGEMTQDEYATVVQDLSDMASANSDVTLSVFHVMDARTSKSLDRLLGYVAQDAPAPLVSLDCFTLAPEAVLRMPVPFMVRHGVILFELLGEEGMLVMLNPYNRRLRDYIQNQLGMTCHVFLAEPRDFDRAITNMRQRLKDEGAPAKA